MKYPKSKFNVRNQNWHYNYSKPSPHPDSVISEHRLSQMSELDLPYPKNPFSNTLSVNDELQLVIELAKCHVCLRVLKEPVTLSCGNSVCHLCLPPFNPHTAWKFECPVINCTRKSHLFGDIKVDVTLQKLTDIIKKEIEINIKHLPNPPCLPSFSSLPPLPSLLAPDSDEESVMDNESLLRLRATSHSPSMAFLESDMWSDVESNVSSPPPNGETYDPSISLVAESSSPLPSPLPSPSLPLSSSLSSSSSPSFPAAASQDDSFKNRMLSELDCQICYCLYYEPITTPCGHTFCKGCILRSVDHTDKCPLCRRKLPGYTFSYNHPINVVLNQIITAVFSRLWYDRRVSVEAELSDDSLDDIPIFVCSLAFPKMPLLLHVFEPRYRLMLRRCMESKHQRFGMVLNGKNGEPYNSYGIMLEISNVTMFPDGRAMVETNGSFRFKVIDRGMRDGYNTGKVERIDDISSEEEEEMEQADLAAAVAAATAGRSGGSSIAQSADVPENEQPFTNNFRDRRECSTAELIMQARFFIDQLRASTPWILQRINATNMNIPDNDSDFSWWIASVFPKDEYERCYLLETTSTRERMKIIMGWITQLREQWWFTRGGCAVM